MSGPDLAGAGPGDSAEVALGDLVARDVALRLGEDLDPGVGAVPGGDRAGRALEQLALGTAIAARVQAGWALDAVAALRARRLAARAGPAAPRHRPGTGPARGGAGVAAARPARPVGHRATDTSSGIGGPSL